MDPALQELIHPSQNPAQVVEALIRLAPGAAAPRGIRIVSRFGDIATCRVRRGDIPRLYGRWPILSFKAARPVGGSTSPALGVQRKYGRVQDKDRRRFSGMPTGKGVMIGMLDWGIDFDHPNFKLPNGKSRLVAIWDQRKKVGRKPMPFGYGRVLTRDDINDALRTTSPYFSLDYHPASADSRGVGAHGTHVMDIAAGSGAIGPAGMAPEADLAFVHLSSGKQNPLYNLGDSVHILEAIDFLDKLAGKQPLVINMSVGRHGGPHDGRTLVEMAIDNFLRCRKDRFVVQSTGNYYLAKTHASGRIKQGNAEVIRLKTDPDDKTTNEIEVWYDGADRLIPRLIHTQSGVHATVYPDKKNSLRYRGEIIGRMYHRTTEPNNGQNHIDIFLFPKAPSGTWKLQLEGKEINRSGQFHAWIERDGGCRECQSRFFSRNADPNTTTGTICNGKESIVVGAVHSLLTNYALPASFSSVGPTTDGRIKPDLVAPGVQVLAAKSSKATARRSTSKLTRMSGTSMAAPHVAGAIAAFRQISGPIHIREVKRRLLASTTIPRNLSNRLGKGILNVRALFQR